MTLRAFLFSCLMILISEGSAAGALKRSEWGTPYNHSLWDQFLKRFVNEQGEVDYGGVRKDPAFLENYLKQVRSLKEGEVGQWPREEQLAFWINVYHAVVVKVIKDAYPLKSIQEIPGVWDIPVIRVGEEGYSLSAISAGELIGNFRDEKIHTVLACGARSCPRLLREPYNGPQVEGQLFLAAREFVNDPVRNPIKAGAKKIQISRIFKWHAKDFELDFGAAENAQGLSNEEYAILSFINHYLEDAAKIQYLEEGRYQVKFLPFDWSLNEWAASPQKLSSESPASK